MSLTSPLSFSSFFFFNDTATTEIYTLSLHDALPISPAASYSAASPAAMPPNARRETGGWTDRNHDEIGRAHLSTPLTRTSPIPSSACKKKAITYAESPRQPPVPPHNQALATLPTPTP